MGDPASRFGNSGTLDTLGGASTQGASRLDELKNLLSSDVEKLVPEKWDGQAANAFDRFTRWFWGKVGAFSGLAREWAQALKEASGLLALARAFFEETQAMATANGVVIGDDLIARPVRPDTTAAQVAAVQGRVEHAWGVAEEARQHLRATNERLREEMVQIDLDLTMDVLSPRSSGGIGSRGSRQRMGASPPIGGLKRWTQSSIKVPRTIKAQYGTRVHKMIEDALAAAGGKKLKMPDGWELMGNNQTMGGTRRPDEVYVNHQTKEVLVVDTVTGPTESFEHNVKSWSYKNEPDIANLVDNQGYKYYSTPAFWLNKQ
jgi:hypothetical protein